MLVTGGLWRAYASLPFAMSSGRITGARCAGSLYAPDDSTPLSWTWIGVPISTVRPGGPLMLLVLAGSRPASLDPPPGSPPLERSPSAVLDFGFCPGISGAGGAAGVLGVANASFIKMSTRGLGGMAQVVPDSFGC